MAHEYHIVGLRSLKEKGKNQDLNGIIVFSENL
jgi:hypothetical protein